MNNIMEDVRTSGAYVLYKGYFVFQVGPTKNGDKLGVVRLGGHREKDEYPLDTAIREVLEESAIMVNPVNSPVTFYLDDWNGKANKIQMNEDVNPILIKGSKEESYTVMYIAVTDNEPKPASESKGLLLLSPKDVELICSRQITLSEFMKHNGIANIKENFNENLVLMPFPQLLFLSKLLKQEPDIMMNLIKCSEQR